MQFVTFYLCLFVWTFLCITRGKWWKFRPIAYMKHIHDSLEADRLDRLTLNRKRAVFEYRKNARMIGFNFASSKFMWICSVILISCQSFYPE